MKKIVDTVLDHLASYDFKKTFAASSVLAPVKDLTWIDDDERRRLRAYTMLEGYYRNKARVWIRKQLDDDGLNAATDPDQRREYGDAAILVKTALSSLLGDTWSIVTDGAIGEDANAQAVRQQELLEEWADKEKFSLKLIESETQSIKFGDSVYVLGWDRRLQRPRLNVYDPGFYFPKFDEHASGSEDFPRRIEIGWEFEEPMPEAGAPDKTETMVRRLLWELVALVNGEWVPVDSLTYEEQDNPDLVVQCWYEDAIWTMESAVEGFIGRPHSLLSEGDVLPYDFIPVVHIPNTVNLQGHFGSSVLADVLQIIDDIQSVDTDLQAAAATTGTPPIAIQGVYGSGEQISYGPGTLIKTGDGSATVIDTSRSLDALIKLKDALLERLSVNGRIPESLLGRVKPNEVPSGIALTLSFTPHAGMVKEMRLVRAYKYQILLSFVVRMYREGGAPGLAAGGEEPISRLLFGSFLPADKQETMTLVMNLYSSKAISLETAVQMLVEAGYPIEDWVQEITRIEQRDFEGANQIMTITGNPELAAEYLGYGPDVVETEMEDGEEEEEPPPSQE